MVDFITFLAFPPNGLLQYGLYYEYDIDRKHYQLQNQKKEFLKDVPHEK